MLILATRTLSALLALVSLAAAQEFRPVLRPFDLIGGEPVTGILTSTVADDGTWHAIVTKRVLPHDLNAELLRTGTPIAAEGMRLSSPSARLRLFHDGALAGTGGNLSAIATLDEFVPPRPQPADALIRNGRVVLLEGEPVAADGLPAGTLCQGIELLAANELDTVLALVRLGTGWNDRGLLRFEFAPDGTARTREMLVRSGQTLPDGSVVGGLVTLEPGLALNERGDWLMRVTTTDGIDHLLSSGGELLRSGQPSPVPGRRIDRILFSYDLNDLGGYAAVVRLDGDAASDTLLVKNGVALAQWGGTVNSSRVLMSNSGQVYWQLGSFMRDTDVILSVGATVGGERVVGFGPSVHNFDVSPSGRFWVGQVVLRTSGKSLVLADFGASRPIPGCAANPGLLRHTDGLVLAGETIRLTLDGPVPAGALARVYFSLAAARPGEDCGVPTPFGELLIDPARRVGSLGAGIFAGGPVPLDLPIPPDPALVDLHVFAQATFVGGGVRMTNGLELEIGAP